MKIIKVLQMIQLIIQIFDVKRGILTLTYNWVGCINNDFTISDDYVLDKIHVFLYFSRRLNMKNIHMCYPLLNIWRGNIDHVKRFSPISLWKHWLYSNIWTNLFVETLKHIVRFWPNCEIIDPVIRFWPKSLTLS